MTAGSSSRSETLSVATVQDLYEAAVETRDWHSFVHRVAGLLRAAGFVLASRSVEMNALEPVEKDKAGVAAQGRNTGVYRLGPSDVGVASWKPVDAGGPGEGRAIAVLGCFLSRDRQRTILVGIKGLVPADEAERERVRLQMAAGVLLRVFTSHRRVCQTRFLNQVHHDVLNKLPFGIFVVDSEGTILSRNARAHHLLARKDGLLVLKGRVALSNPVESQRLMQSLARAARREEFSPEHDAMAVSRPSMGPPLPVLVLPLREAVGNLGPTPPSAALMIVGDPECRYEIAPDVTARFFGLTLAEARVLVDLVNGASLNEMAEARDLTRNTLKTQLNQVFRKTQTNRQSDLVKVVLSSPSIVISLREPDVAPDFSEPTSDDPLGIGLTAIPS